MSIQHGFMVLQILRSMSLKHFPNRLFFIWTFACQGKISLTLIDGLARLSGTDTSRLRPNYLADFAKIIRFQPFFINVSSTFDSNLTELICIRIQTKRAGFGSVSKLWKPVLTLTSSWESKFLLLLETECDRFGLNYNWRKPVRFRLQSERESVWFRLQRDKVTLFPTPSWESWFQFRLQSKSRSYGASYSIWQHVHQNLFFIKLCLCIQVHIAEMFNV